MAIALASMYRTLIAQRPALLPAPRPTTVATIAQRVIGTPAVLQYQPRPSVSVASAPAPAPVVHACGGRCGSPSSGAASGGMPAASAAPSLSLASTAALPPPATADSAKVNADPDPAAPAEETGGPSLLIWILIAVTIWWVVSRERGGRSLW